MSELKNFRIIGPCRGPTGYDNHVRQICKTLSQLNRPFEFREFAGWSPVALPGNWLSEIPAFPATREEPQLCLHFVMPTQVTPCEGTMNINFSMFEATTIPPSWISHSRQHDHIIVPTLSSAKAWARSGIPQNKISICPLGVDASIFKPGIPAVNLGTINGKPVSAYSVRMMNISDLIPRKNISGLLHAWLEATNSPDDAVLILKAGLYHTDLHTWLQQEIAGIEMKAGKKFSEAAPICWITDLLPPDTMPSLYAAGTHYISMSHGEGWDLPMMEAGACGLQLIAPRHSAYEDWMHEAWTCFIPSVEIAVPPAHSPTLLSGLRFWLPEHNAAVKIIRRAVKGEQLSVQHASEAIRSTYTWENTTLRLMEILDGLNAEAPRKFKSPQEYPANVRSAFMELCSTKMYRYTLSGIGSQLLEMMPDFSIGALGFIPMGIPVQWTLEERSDGSPQLVIFNDHGARFFLSKDEEGNWKGSLNAQTEMLLQPVYETCTEEEKIHYLSLQEKLIASFSEIPLKPGAGRGIVIPGGGEKYFPGAWALIHLLRITLKCDLPIELWHLGAEELPQQAIPALQKLNVNCRDAYAEGYKPGAISRKGWPLKVFALLNTSFSEVLLLDSDNVPVRDPSFLFDAPAYKKTGALFWPDFGSLGKHRAIWEVCDVPYRDEPELESGQLVVDRSKHLNALTLAMFYNTHADFYYRLINGDKETFHMAWRRLNMDYTLIGTPVFHLPYTMVQHDPSGKPLFQHRYGDKLRRDLRNYRIEGFVHEAECIGFIQLLNKSEQQPSQQDERVAELLRQAEEQICSIRYFEYERIGHDKRRMEFLPDGSIGEGTQQHERTWRMGCTNHHPVIIIEGEEGISCRLSQDDAGVWEGRWLLQERMYVRLSPCF
jgi:glycosyltransferase involved in cell wall biosynthesis